ncbi:MAG: DDE-type integrase/transposase/recombinase [Gammaproteobacteria bacterium]|nr:DDE-type integrase/transposase/recombinase [Gammaproteobacteria bacterium]
MSAIDFRYACFPSLLFKCGHSLVIPRKDAKSPFFKKAISSSGLPEKVTIDKSGANAAALERLNLLLFLSSLWCLFIEVRRIKYLNNLVEQDHRAIKRLTRPMLGFKSFESANATIAGIELHHMLKKGQMENHQNLPAWQQFSLLAV